MSVENPEISSINPEEGDSEDLRVAKQLACAHFVNRMADDEIYINSEHNSEEDSKKYQKRYLKYKTWYDDIRRGNFDDAENFLREELEIIDKVVLDSGKPIRERMQEKRRTGQRQTG